jgi:hypothetical protein
MPNRILQGWVGRGTWQVISQVLGVVGVEVLSRWLLQIGQMEHIAAYAAPIDEHKEATEKQKT